MTLTSQLRPLQQAAVGKVADEGAQAEAPGRRRLAMRHAVLQAAQPVAVDGDHVAQLVRETAAGLVTVFGGCLLYTF